MGFIPIDFADQIGGIIIIPTEVSVTGELFQGELAIDLQHTNLLDPTFRSPNDISEGSEVITEFYKSSDGISFNSVASGSDVLSGTAITVDDSFAGVLYMSLTTDDETFIDPEATTNVNQHITSFVWQDVSNNGIKNWVFRIDLVDIPEKQGFQTASTISIITKVLDNDDSPTLNSPPDITAIGVGSGVVNYILWEMTVAESGGICDCGRASAQYEYNLRFEDGNVDVWNVGQSNLEIPNIGIISLSEFDEEILSSTLTLYRYKVGTGASIDQANYVITSSNGDEVHKIPAKIVTNFSASGTSSFTIEFTVKLVNPVGTTDVIDDEIVLDRDP